MGRSENSSPIRIPFQEMVVRKLLIHEKHATNTTNQLTIPFAQDGEGNIENLLMGFERDYDDENVLITGTVGSGKTSLLQTIIFSAAINYKPEELQIWIDSQKWYEYSFLSEMFDSLTIIIDSDNTEDNESFLPGILSDELERRMSILRTSNEPNILHYWNHKTEKNYEPLPRILLIADESQWINIDCYNSKKIERLCRLGRAVGINCIFACQNPHIFWGNLSGYFGIRIAMRCNNPDEFWYSLNLPSGGIENVSTTFRTLLQGEFFLAHNGGEYDYLKKLTAIKLR